MLKNILIGLDGSEYCKDALKTAIALSKNFGAKLYGLGIVDLPGIFDPSFGVAGGMHFKKSADQKQYEEAKKRVGACLREFQRQCEEAQIQHEVRQAESSPLNAFIERAVGYDIIIMGQETFFHEDNRGRPCDTLLRLLKDTPRPVVVPPKSHSFEYSINNPAVIAFDGSIPSARAMQVFTLLSYDDPRNEVHLITVCDDEEEGRSRQEKAILYLERWYGRKPTTALLKGRRPESILEYTAKVNARVLVMGTYGRTGFRKFFFGSTTRYILTNTNTMLFLYH